MFIHKSIHPFKDGQEIDLQSEAVEAVERRAKKITDFGGNK